MGIPSYFSYILKNHSKIIKKIEKNRKPNNFYLDCNSIIYDVINNSENNITELSKNNVIINLVLSKIEDYIIFVSPDTNVYIAFDGVAPFAKLEQQRQRRYKSWYQSKIHDRIFLNKKETKKETKKENKKWNTAAITPGTEFMKELNCSVINYFNDATKYNVQNLIVSTSNEIGEGEHKIFDFIRKNKDYHLNSSSIIYGLDADLIMLSINHLPINPEIYLFREAPHFGTLPVSESHSDSYIMDIGELSKQIMIKNIYDYIFLCFFLGNDFMPHFPSLNIRTGGIDKLINAYNETIDQSKEKLTDGVRIYWKNVRKLCVFLVKQEENYFIEEMKLRDKKEYMYKRHEEKTPENIYKKFELLPSYEREIEKYINPINQCWEQRYYETLFKFQGDDISRKNRVSLNYLEGLEWNMKYYTSGCPDWNWKYEYNYPPLISDLLKVMPYFETELIELHIAEPVSELFQLCYVLPKNSRYLLPPFLREYYEDDTEENVEFIWCFCKYFWECHVELPDIDIIKLQKCINSSSV